MLSKLAVRRLTKLADFMDALPESENKHFDMRDYSLKRASVCGTIMCAAGWAATMPYFNELGMTPENVGDIDAQIFDIDMEQWADLFDSTLAFTIKTPQEWAAHCRDYIEANS